MDIEKIILSIINIDMKKYEKLALILQLIIEYCTIKQNSYFILGSYALRESRTISDLDVNMDFEEFDKLESKAIFGKVEVYNEQIRWFYDLTKEYQKIDKDAVDFSIEIFKKKPSEGFPNEKFSLSYLIKSNGLEIDKFGHPYFSLKTLLEWKKIMNRPKDQPDIELINNLLIKKEYQYEQKYLKYKNKYLKLKNY